LTDWVQAGRYAVRLDPSTYAGGPDKAAGYLRASAPRKMGLTRQIRVSDAALAEGDVQLTVHLESDGRENAVAFSFAFDPAALCFTEAKPGSGLPAGTLLQVNTAQAESGEVGVLLAAQPGQTFSEGTRELLVLNLRTKAASAGSYPVRLTDDPVRREVSDAVAELLVAEFVGGTVHIEAEPALEVAATSESITLSWPAWATNYTLQSASGPISSGMWTNVPVAIGTEGGKATVKLPVSGSAGFYRLHRP
jgi:hypothetical protein